MDRTGVGPVEKASEDGKGGPRLLGNMAQNDRTIKIVQSKNTAIESPTK